MKSFTMRMAFTYLALVVFAASLNAQPIIQFSHSRGYHTSDFDLTLTIPDGMVAHYTIDGSEPTLNDPQVTGPIRIASRANVPNGISMISSISTSYATWAPPKNTVFKVTPFRVALFNNGVKQGSTQTHTYIIDPAGADRYQLPVISLVTDSLHLFDYETGIYVLGKIYDTWKAANPGVAENGGTPANFHERGDEWERPVHIELFEDDGSIGMAQDAGIRMHGSWARAFRQKTFRLYARNDYSTNRFNYQLFPDRESTDYRRFILRNSGQDWTKTMIRDGFMQRLVQDLSFDTQYFRQTIVFLNGEFWGIHNIRDRYDDHYVEQLYGVSRNLVDYLEINGVVKEGENQHYKDMISFIRSNNIAAPINFASLTTMMDVYNFGEYNMSNIYINNRDWPHNNIEYWRKRTPEYTPIAPYGQDGRWRWMMKDTDFGFGWNLGADAWKFDMLSHALSPTGNGYEWSTLILRSLMTNSIYRNWFITRFADLLNSNFHPDRVLYELNSISGNIKPHIQEHLDRWGYNDDRWATPQTEADWESNLDLMRHFATERATIMRTLLNIRFNLGGTYELTIDRSNPEQGYVQVNTLELKSSTPWVAEQGATWSGRYFKNMNLTLKAIPADGYVFDGWSGDLNSSADSVVLRSDVNITAIPRFVLGTNNEPNLAEVPLTTELLPNYPNPFNPTTTISWVQSQSAKVTIEIVDMNGRIISRIVNNSFTSGRHTITYDGSNLSSGIYLIRLQSGSFSSIRKIALIK